MGMLYRRFYHDADSSTLRMLYTTFARSLLEYAVPVWDPHLVRDIEDIESVQRFATKVCTRTWWGVDGQNWLSMLNLTTLETRRTILKYCFLYKVLNGLTFLPNPSIIPRPNTSHDTRSHTLTLQVPFAHTVVKLPASAMIYHLRLYHLPPLPPLRELVTIMYYTNYPFCLYVFVSLLLPL